MSYKKFKKEIWAYYRLHKRDFPWRPPALKLQKDGKARNPYQIVVSEIMLQQTQVDRIVPKYAIFLKRFPNFGSLANVPIREVLAVWQGLGYNRRALYLQRIAEIVVQEYGGKLPSDVDILDRMPGIGRHTAGSIVAFAFNKPSLFIETNIRRVFIHFFFPSKRKVDDRGIIKLVEATVDQKNPREWYYALMDYGAMLGKQIANPNRRSAHYRKQSPFEGSTRQLRGEILRMALRPQPLTFAAIIKKTRRNKTEITAALRELEKEDFIKIHKNKIRLVE